MDKIDYTDPICPFDTEQYKNAPGDQSSSGAIPVRDIITQLDRLLGTEQYEKAGELLEKWKKEAQKLGDIRGELSIQNELLGFHRQYGKMEDETETIRRTKELLTLVELGKADTAGTILLNIGTALCASGHPEEALLSYSDACRSWGSILPPNDYRFAALYNNMAGAYETCGEISFAKEYYRKAIRIMEKGGARPDTAVSLINLAKVIRDENPEDIEVDQLVHRAAEILLSSSLNRDAYYAHTCRKCEDPLLYLGFFRYASLLRKEADAIYERSRKG